MSEAEAFLKDLEETQGGTATLLAFADWLIDRGFIDNGIACRWMAKGEGKFPFKRLDVRRLPWVWVKNPSFRGSQPRSALVKIVRLNAPRAVLPRVVYEMMPYIEKTWYTGHGTLEGAITNLARSLRLLRDIVEC